MGSEMCIRDSDQGVSRFGAENFTTLALADGGEARLLRDSAAGATPVAACAPLPWRMGDAQMAVVRHALNGRAGALAPHGDRLVHEADQSARSRPRLSFVSRFIFFFSRSLTVELVCGDTLWECNSLRKR